MPSNLNRSQFTSKPLRSRKCRNTSYINKSEPLAVHFPSSRGAETVEMRRISSNLNRSRLVGARGASQTEESACSLSQHRCQFLQRMKRGEILSQNCCFSFAGLCTLSPFKVSLLFLLRAPTCYKPEPQALGSTPRSVAASRFLLQQAELS